jgi:hypothetical protein
MKTIEVKVSMRNNKEQSVHLDELSFYFDAVAKDRYDQGTLSRRNGQVLALRERLLSMPEYEFDAAMKTMEKIVGQSPQHSPVIDQRQRYELHKQAKMLYERVEPTGSVSRVDSTIVDKI